MNSFYNIVSVVVPMYNAQLTITECIDSIILQGDIVNEIIIIDDKSTDDSLKVLSKYNNNEKIKVISLEVNSGVGYSRNLGIKSSTSRFIAFLDSDDIWCENKIDIQVNYMLKENAAISCTNYIINNSVFDVEKTFLTRKDLSYENRIGCSTVIIDTDMIKKELILFPIIRKRQDYALWFIILNIVEKVFVLREPLVVYRNSRNSLSSNKVTLLKYNFYVLKKYAGYGTLKSFYYLFFNIYFSILKRLKL